MHLAIACNSSGLRMQLHLNFRWFLVTFATMVWLVVPSSFKMDEFYTLICGNMLLCIQLYIFVLYKYVTIYTILYIYLTNMLPKNLSSKPQFNFICLKQTMTPFISKEHILFISKPIWMIFVALDALGGGLQFS